MKTSLITTNCLNHLEMNNKVSLGTELTEPSDAKPSPIISHNHQISETIPMAPDLMLFQNMEIHSECCHSLKYSWNNWNDTPSGASNDKAISNIRCVAMERMVAILNYYNSLMLYTNTTDDQYLILMAQFVEFCDKHYGERMMLEDYIHCITEHHDNNSIMKMRAGSKWQCFVDFQKCRIIHSHYRDRSQYEKEPVAFYIEIMDTMHYNLLHLEDVGLRVNLPSNNNNARNITGLVDESLLKMSKTIQRKRQRYPVRRLNGGVKSTKFSIFSKNVKRTRVLDRVLKATWIKSKNQSVFDDFHHFLESHEFDTDALDGDIAVFVQCGYSHLQNHLRVYGDVFDALRRCLRHHRVSGASFSTGKWFVYWPWYEGQTVESLMMRPSYWQHIDFGGHSMKSLAVKPHFENLKEEIVGSGIISRFQFVTVIAKKAKRYLHTSRCKELVNATKSCRRSYKNQAKNEKLVAQLTF